MSIRLVELDSDFWVNPKEVTAVRTIEAGVVVFTSGGHSLRLDTEDGDPASELLQYVVNRLQNS